MNGTGRAVAVVTVHASPLGAPGRGENGGMNLAIRRICEQLASQGVPTDVFTRRDDPGLPSEELIAPGSRLIRLPAGPPVPLPKQDVLIHLPEFTGLMDEHARSELRRYRLVHAHYWLSGEVADAVSGLWRVPWVQSFHTLAGAKSGAGMPADPARAAAETSLARRAGRIIASSRAEKADIARWTGADRDRICVVPLGVDLARYIPHGTDAYRHSLGLRGRRVVAYAGRLERLKGVDLLLEAFSVVRATGGYGDTTLLVAGGDSQDGTSQSDDPDGELGRLQHLATSLHIGDHVRFLGALRGSAVADLLAIADVVVVPSRTESFGLVALEALASGTPVVTAAVGGLREIVEDGVTGYVVEERTAEAFATSIAAVLDDRTIAATMSVEGRRRAEQFTWYRSARRLSAIFERMTSPGHEREDPCGEPTPCP